jgi:hypothetical protein
MDQTTQQDNEKMMTMNINIFKDFAFPDSEIESTLNPIIREWMIYYKETITNETYSFHTRYEMILCELETIKRNDEINNTNNHLDILYSYSDIIQTLFNKN